MRSLQIHGDHHTEIIYRKPIICNMIHIVLLFFSNNQHCEHPFIILHIMGGDKLRHSTFRTKKGGIHFIISLLSFEG